MNWLEKFIPSCCSSRQPSNIPRNLRPGIPSMPEILISSEVKEPDFSISDPLSQISSAYETPKDPLRLIKTKKCQSPSTSESRRSTSHTISSLDTVSLNLGIIYLEQLSCWVCGRGAKGYCPMCPSRRYCNQCYPTKHKTFETNHQFIAYPDKKVRAGKVGNLIKIKSLM